jgi:hypothetical protein
MSATSAGYKPVQATNFSEPFSIVLENYDKIIMLGDLF